MEAQREIVIEGVKNSRLRGIDTSQLRSAANFAAKSNKPMLAIQLLAKAAESNLAQTADAVRWAESAAKVSLTESSQLARNNGLVGVSVRAIAPLPPMGSYFIEIVYEREDVKKRDPLGSGYLTGVTVSATAVDEATLLPEKLVAIADAGLPALLSTSLLLPLPLPSLLWRTESPHHLHLLSSIQSPSLWTRWLLWRRR